MERNPDPKGESTQRSNSEVADQAIVHAQDLSYSYKDGTRVSFPDFTFLPGEHTLILGPSGTGKSTLLHVMSGILRGYQGSMSVSSTELSGLDNAGMDAFRGRHIGLVFQKPHFIPSLSIAENIRLPLHLIGQKSDAVFFESLVTHLGIEGLLRKVPKSLSVGELQRAAIARALITRPSLVLADEPTSALDDANCEAVVRLLKNEAEFSGGTLIIVTHDTRLQGLFEHAVRLKRD